MNEEKQIAKALLEAKKLHEASYEDLFPLSTECGEYKRGMEECVQEAFEKEGLSTNLWSLLNLAMHWWNDVELWCEDILADREIPKGPYDEILKDKGE